MTTTTTMTEAIRLKTENARLRGVLQGIEAALRRETEADICVHHRTFCSFHAKQVRAALATEEGS